MILIRNASNMKVLALVDSINGKMSQFIQQNDHQELIDDMREPAVIEDGD